MKIAAIIGLATALVLFLVAITIIGSVDMVPAPPPAPLPVEPDLLTRHVNLTRRVNPEHFYWCPEHSNPESARLSDKLYAAYERGQELELKPLTPELRKLRDKFIIP